MKMKLILAIILVFIATEYSYSQDANFNIIGAGARARGMGGAFIGLADDATAVSWNPAGLAKLEKPEASVVGLYESYSISTDIPDADTDPYESSHFSLNFLSGAFPLSVGERNLVAAVALQQVVDLYYKYDGDDYEAERTGGINAITPAVGLQLTPTFSVGASVNIFTGKTNYTYEDRYYGDEGEAEYQYSGTNFTIGGLFDYNKFRFGFVYKTPFGLGEEEEDLDYDVTIHMPQMVGLGVAYMASENLTVAADYEMRSYSDTELENNDTGDKMEAGWEDINQLRLGAEYLFISGNSILPMRLGFATTPTLYTDDNDDQITGMNITAGIGIIMGNINLDLGLEYNTYSYEIDDGFDTYDYSDDYLRFIISGVFHFGD